MEDSEAGIGYFEVVQQVMKKRNESNDVEIEEYFEVSYREIDFLVFTCFGN